MKTYLAVFLLLVGAAMAQPHHHTKTTCHADSTYMYGDPGTNQDNTLFCGSTWAVAIPVAGNLGNGVETLATAYVPDHFFSGYLPVNSYTQSSVCIQTPSDKVVRCNDNTWNQALVVTYGATGIDGGLMWAWVTLDGIEQQTRRAGESLP